MTSPNGLPGYDRRWRCIRLHLPLRPLWLCRVCAAPWPCPPARLLLGMEYRRDLVALSVYMAGMLHEAAADLWRLNPNPHPDPAELFTRFIGWTRPGRNRPGPVRDVDPAG